MAIAQVLIAAEKHTTVELKINMQIFITWCYMV